MAMLAEPRRKQRIGPNPRGKFFTEDDDNRGRQMLMKMGWKTGDGLGATSQGMNEPIKPKINTDSRGLGFDRKKDPWVAHNEEFEQLLNNLNTSAATDDTISKPKSCDDESSNSANESLEKKSKGSRSRIHYHKFVKNKDLSRASTKDISCIFGKSLDETSAVFSVLNGQSLEESEPLKPVVAYTSGVKGFVKSEDAAADVLEKQVKKKKKKSSKEIDPEATAENIEDSTSEEPAETAEKSEKSKKKKKKKSQDLLEEAPCGKLENTTNDDEGELEDGIPEPEVASVEESPVEEPGINEVPKKKKKKSKKHKNGDSEPEEETTATITPSLSTNECESHEMPEEHNQCETEDSSIKKRKKKKKYIVEEEIEDLAKSTEDEPKIKKSKKKSKNKDAEPEEVVETEEIENNAPESSCIPETEMSPKKKKKSKKRKTCNDEDDDGETETAQLSVSIDDNKSTDNQCEAETTSSKKKKKRKKNHAENPEEVNESEPSLEDPSKSNPNKTSESDNPEKFINRGSIVDYFKSKMQKKGLTLPSSITM